MQMNLSLGPVTCSTILSNNFLLTKNCCSGLYKIHYPNCGVKTWVSAAPLI